MIRASSLARWVASAVVAAAAGMLGAAIALMLVVSVACATRFN
jgi:hypothetical protein